MTAVWDERQIAEIERSIGYEFRNKELLKRSFTLSSASKENNERLEFLGDAILEYYVSEFLFSAFPDSSEGEMTTLRAQYVDDENLSAIVEKAGWQEYLIYDGTAKDNRGKKAIGSLFEAIVGGILLDGGEERAKAFLKAHVRLLREAKNYKGDLQEYLQTRGESAPIYESEKSGKDNCPTFTSTAKASCGGKAYAATGEGKSKKDAEKAAAQALLKLLQGDSE